MQIRHSHPEEQDMSTRPKLFAGALILGLCAAATQDEPAALPRAFIDGTGPGWTALSLKDFVNVNGKVDTWTEKVG